MSTERRGSLKHEKKYCRHENPLRVGAEGWGGSALAEARQTGWDFWQKAEGGALGRRLGLGVLGRRVQGTASRG